MTYEDLKEVNKSLTTVQIKGKEYVEVNKRVIAFRKLFPMGTIETDVLSDDGERCLIRATVKVDDLVLATGHAFEEKSNSYINKTSYIENGETSAIGRALGMLGIGIETSIASAEEVDNAITNQPISKKEQTMLLKLWTDHGGTEENLLSHCKVEKISDITGAKFAQVMNQLREKDGK